MPFRALCGAVLALALVAGHAIAQPAKPFTRHEATETIADARRIVNPQGVQWLGKVHIGGIDQWVSIRGRDRRNPVLLVVHGGPGYVLMPMAWWSFRDEEEYFTVVQWDQRGAGKTYLLNDPGKVGPTLTLERTVRDAEELTAWIRRKLARKKLFLLGHSAGTAIGLEMAARDPGELYAYIGVGEMTDMPESERRGWRFAMAAAQRAHNAQAIRELAAIAPYFVPGRPGSLEDVYTERKWTEAFGGAMAYRTGSDADTDLARLSPDYTDQELPHLWDGNRFTEHYLLAGYLDRDWSTFRKFACPIIIFAGRHDHIVDSDVVAGWFAKVEAPLKQFVWFENSGHMPMTEEPGKFLVSLLRYARPLAKDEP